MFIYFVTLLLALPVIASATPEDDQQKLQNHFLNKAPALPLDSYASDHYKITNNISRSGPPLYNHLNQLGEELLSSNFSNGRSYTYCFRSSGISIGSDYPYFDVLSARVTTLAMEINACREENGETPYSYDSTEMEAILLHMMDNSRKNITNVIMPNDKAAEQAFYKGKQFFFSRRGQLDMACAHCHIDHADKRYGSEFIPPALGLPLRMPRYNSATQEVTTLHERFNQCLSYTKASPFPLQSETLRNLEFYLFYVNNGLPLNAPSVK